MFKSTSEEYFEYVWALIKDRFDHGVWPNLFAFLGVPDVHFNGFESHLYTLSRRYSNANTKLWPKSIPHFVDFTKPSTKSERKLVKIGLLLAACRLYPFCALYTPGYLKYP